MYQSVTFAQRLRASFFRQRRLFVVCLVGTTIVPAVVLIKQPRKYAAWASTRVVKDPVAAGLGLTPDNQTWITAAQRNVSQFKDLISDDQPGGFLERVLANANLDRPVKVDPRARDRRMRDLRSNLSVDAPSDEVFTITLVWDQPGECERLVKSFQKEFVRAAGQSKQAKSVATERFLSTQIQSYERRMREAEQALIQFKQANLGNTPEQEAADLKQLSLLRAQLDDLKIASRDSEKKRDAIKRRLSQIKPRSVLEQTLMDDPRVRQLRQLTADREQMLAEYKPASDEIQDIDRRIAALKASVERDRVSAGSANVVETKLQENPEYRSLMQQLTDANVAEETQRARVQLLQRRIDEDERRMQKLPSSQRTLTDRMRDYDILKTQYEKLLKQREDTRIQGNLEGVTASSTLTPIGQVYAEATTGGKKSLLLLVAACVAGLVLSFGLVFLREWLDTSVRYAEDVERAFGFPVLATLPDFSTVPGVASLPPDLGRRSLAEGR